MNKVRMVTYEPMIFKKRKENKIVKNKVDILPYLDASFRTEPSLNVEYPGISSLCRGEKLAPKLKKGDKVVYIAKKNKYDQDFKHRRLVAILAVIEIKNCHYAASKWYEENNYTLPKNCIVDGNPPLSFDKTTVKDQSTIDEREKVYNYRAKKYPKFNICKKIYLNLEIPPIITEEKMKEIFDNKIPVIQNYKILNENQYRELETLSQNN